MAKGDGSVKRGEASTEAISIITKNREQTYGTPEDSFSAIGKLWFCYTSMVEPGKYSLSHMVAMYMALMKIGRIATGQVGHRDNYVDAIGYLDIAATLAMPEKDNA